MFQPAALGSLRGTLHDWCNNIITRDGDPLRPDAWAGTDAVNFWIDQWNNTCRVNITVTSNERHGAPIQQKLDSLFNGWGNCKAPNLCPRPNKRPVMRKNFKYYDVINGCALWSQRLLISCISKYHTPLHNPWQTLRLFVGLCKHFRTIRK